MTRGKWLLCTLVIAGIFFISCKSVNATDHSSETEIPQLIEYPLVKNDVEIVIVEAPRVAIPEVKEPVKLFHGYTDDEIALLHRLGMSEAGVLEVDAIQAVIQVAMNRKNSNDYPDTIEGVIYQKINGHPQFSTRDNGDPNEKCYTAVANAIASPEAFPTDMYWFNSDHYPNYGHPYTIIDGMYFSTETDYNVEEVGE